MSTKSLDADAIITRATPATHQHAHEIQPYGHLVRMPIALSETTCKESVESLNQILADTITLGDTPEVFESLKRRSGQCKVLIAP